MDARTVQRPGPCDIAIVGIAGRFPGAADVRRFWANICAGVESISRFDDSELEDAFEPAVRADAKFVRARSVLDAVDGFDAGFFAMQSREAELTDPQHRIFLECCWEALEDAGYDPAAYPGSIGVFAGCSINSYFLRNVLHDRALVERFTSDYQVGSYPELLGAGHDFLATRVAYKLNLRGPAMTLQSACSTSLNAVAQACQNLMLGQADMMLAGAVSITFPQKRGYVYQPGGMVSPDGHCRTFDAAANGTVFGSGAGVVVLKRFADAQADGDTVYARIRGFGVNNDGSGKIGYTAPSSDGQAAAIAAAHRMADVPADSIAFVECHGTATPLGDPIEFAALANVFGAARDGVKTCALGSVKTNVGHLDVAAGMTSLIKTVLAIQTGKIPPTLHFTTPNPRIDLDPSPFFVNTQLIDWPGTAECRRAGVSAFGVGGTNVHLLLESAPRAEAAAGVAAAPQLIVFSARTGSALRAAREQLAAYFAAAEEHDFAAAAYTLQAGRRAFAHRGAVVAATPAEAARALSAPNPGTGEPASATDGSVAFMFPGQGAQYPGMGRDLYARVPAFRAAVDRCADLLAPHIGIDVRDTLFNASADRAQIASTDIAQPAIFTIEYALAQTWLAWGVRPAAMIGHSVGEFVAACVAGVMSLEDALVCVAERGRLMRGLPRGAMVAVRLSDADLAQMIDSELAIAAINGPRQCVAAGSFEAVEVLESRLSAHGALFRRLDTSHAFHSPMVDSIVAPLAARVAGLTLMKPTVPYVSTVTGDWITAAEATSPDYWAAHCRQPVRFAAGIATLIDAGIGVFLEVGPGNALATFVRQCAGKDVGTVASSLPDRAGERDDVATMLAALGALWSAGIAPDWHAVSAPAQQRRIALPTYPFERKRHWIEAAPAPAAVPQPAVPDHNHPPMETTILASTPAPEINAAASRGELERRLADLLEELSGEEIGAADRATSFLALGFDSLSLGRFASLLQTRFDVSVTFRQLLGDLPSIAALAAHIAAVAPAQATPPPAAGRANISPAPLPPPASSAGNAAVAAPSGAIEALMRDQLAAMQQLMREQLLALTGNGNGNGHVPAPTPPAGASLEPSPSAAVPVSIPEPPSRFEVFRPGTNGNVRSEISVAQRAHIATLIARTTARTGQSKALTQNARGVLADPRVAAGFRSEWKEMVYPITCVRAKGSRLWDIDGNEYIDLLNGFGQTAFGHAPDFVVAAISAQLERGFAIGPQTELAPEVAQLFCELTGNERVTFCNTGSEAVMAALRLARTVTGRDRIVVFNGAYHGQFDEVLVKGARTSPRALPVAPGIPSESVANMTVLTYGAPESLEWIRTHAGELAAVVVEPVQSRHPALQPKAFLEELRTITSGSGTALVFDEVVTGFRVHPGGMQAVFGIRADLATYGKVVGGGMPIGILGGRARFMDALDGGTWQYGDDSIPEVAPTFFAGTFVRHPLVMAAVLAVLKHLKAAGPGLQDALTARTAGLVGRLNDELERRGLTSRIETFGSLFYFNFTAEERLAGLLYYHLRNRGVYIQEGFPCFLTTCHTEADIDHIVGAWRDSLAELAAVGIFLGTAAAPAAGPTTVALTEEQIEIWLAAQLGDDASCSFNESVTLRLSGTLDEARFRDAWNTVVARHDALRATLSPTGELLEIAPPGRFEFAVHDVRSEADPELPLAAAIAREARTPFNMVEGPLVRGQLLRLSGEEHAFIFTAHHIICDGWSMNIVLNEVAALYAGSAAGGGVQLPAPLQFSLYARMQQQRDPAEAAKIEAYWLEQFAEPVRPLELPTDRPRPALRTFNGATRTVHIDAARSLRIKKAGARNGCTLFATLLSSFMALIGRLADQTDITIGIPAAGQSVLEGEILVGHCVDFLPIRSRWNGDARIADVLAGVKRSVLNAYEHQRYTLGTLVRKLNMPRESSRLPLTEIQFNLERLADGLELDGLQVKIEPNPKAFVNFDLFVNVIESDAGLRVDCDYNTDLFDAATIDRWLAHYGTMLDAIVADTEAPVGRISLLSDVERRHVLAGLNATSAAGFGDMLIHTLFESQAAARPDADALSAGPIQLTYGELDGRANALAHYLRSRAGRSDRPVAICVERSADALIALLATLKAGYAYIPLDPSHPAARLRHILADSAVAALVTDGSSGVDLAAPGTPVVHLGLDRDAIAAGPATAPSVAQSPDSLAYVIYTSGSTGSPKGVEITHRSVVNLLCAMSQRPGLTAADVLLAVTTISFDIAALELFLPLTVGAHVVIAPNDAVADGHALLAELMRSRATTMQATPSTWQMLLEAGFVSRPGFTMLAGGEALPRELADRLLAGGGRLWNMYGPTETTIWSSCREILADGTPITVGPPILNTQFYVLDAKDEPLAIGQTGQLHIGGMGVARGYVRRPELTAEKFVANPFAPGRMYRTGDAARLLPSGEVQLLGRLDDQVKVRGFRIELGEIEAVLVRRANVAAAAVVLRDVTPGDARLVAYYIERPEWPQTPATLRAALSAELPAYMIPALYVRLDALPVSPNGKLDRAALPAPATAAPLEAEFREPRTATEQLLAQIWAETLQRERIGIGDDIFALGADSIHIFRITARANKQGLKFAAKQLIRHRTVGALAEFLDSTKASAAVDGTVLRSPADLPAYRIAEPAPRRA